MILPRYDQISETEAWKELLVRVREVAGQIKARVCQIMDPQQGCDSNALNALNSDQSQELEDPESGPMD
jgi:hypothetical protein